VRIIYRYSHVFKLINRKISTMKKLFAGIIAILASINIQAQDIKYNDPNAEVRNVSGFTGVSVASGIELVLTQGSSEAVAVSASSTEYRDRIKTEIKDGMLKIYYDAGSGKMNWNNKKNIRLKAYVSAITLKAITVSSGATLDIQGALKADDMALDLSSGSIFKGEINAKIMKVEQGSGAEAKLSGSAQDLAITVNSGGNFKGYNFVVNKCDARVSSGGSVEITVNAELDAKASSGGSVQYKGACAVKKNTSSGGAVVSKSK
jgi:Putative auto-transporter adhesin, head GIN domain